LILVSIVLSRNQKATNQNDMLALPIVCRTRQEQDMKAFTWIVIVSILLRVALLVYGEWQDSHFAVKFTDIDYLVFTDGARYVSEGLSPYLRSTYRYTPLLSWILLPNVLVSPVFGKLLFVAADLLVGVLIYRILRYRNASETAATWYSTLWLWNPLVIVISARGNAESLLCVLCVSTIERLYAKRILQAAFLYGLAVHLKLYPILYSIPLMVFLNKDYGVDPSRKLKASANAALAGRSTPMAYLNKWRLQFAIASAAVFFALTGLMYCM
jgi:phosphatidylinositol glycan class M